MKKLKCLYENLIEVDLFEEFWEYNKKCRESSYYLKSLMIKLKEMMIVENENQHIDEIEKECNNLYLNGKKYLEEYYNLDNKFFQKSTDSNINKLTNNESDVEINHSELLNLFSSMLVLKSELDLVQINILDIIIEINKSNIEKLIKGNDTLESDFLAELNLDVLSLESTHSTDEDKIVNYEIDIKNSKLKKELLNEGEKFPKYIKVKDYTYNLLRLRKKYVKYDKLFVKYLGMIKDEKEKEILNKRNEYQYYFNIIITISTVISLIIAIIGLIIE